MEWIDEIPEHWSISKLKYSDQVIMGQSPSSDDYSDRDFGTLPFLQGNADFKDLYPIPRIWCDTANKIADRGDILLSVRAPIGAVNISDQEYGIGRGLCAIRSIKSNPKYLYYLTISLNEELNSIGTGSTYTAVSVNDIKNVFIPIIQCDEQNIIANFLDHKTHLIDTLIEKKQKQIELLKEQRTSIINQAVTKGLNPNVKMKDSGIEWLGEKPAHWEVIKLKWAVSKIGSGITPRGGSEVYVDSGIPLLRSQNIHFDGLKLQDVAYITEETHHEMSNSEVKKRDVLINITGASIGRCTYVPQNLRIANVNQHVCILRPKKNILSKYLNYYLSSHKGQFQVFLSQTGTSREGLNFTQLGNFIFILPKVSEQNEIINFIETKDGKIFESIGEILSQINLLKEYRTTLISEIVTGKIDVRDEV